MKPSFRICVSRHALSIAIGGACIAGVGLSSAHVLERLRSHHVLTANASGSATATIYPDVAANGPIGIEPWRVTLSADASAPDSTSLDDGFPVKVQFLLKIDDESGLQESAESQIREKLVRYLKPTLAIAGMTVAPNVPTSVSSDLASVWSVKASEAGSFVGVVKTALESPGLFRGTRYLVELPGDLVLTITVTDPPLGPIGYVGVAASVVGLFLTITGLISFVWSWRDRRAQRRAEDDAKRNKIILPGS